MPNCEGTTWVSTVREGGKNGPVIERASFRIDSEDASGDFTGTFQVDGGSEEDIEGRCTGARIEFTRLESTPVYRYHGIFIFMGPIKRFIRGARDEVSFTPEEARVAFAASASPSDATLSEADADNLAARTFVESFPLVPDDWTGERT